MIILKKIWDNRRYVLKRSLIGTSSIFAVVGFVGIFVSFGDFWDVGLSLLCRIGIACCIVVGVWLVVATFCSLYVLFKSRYRVLELSEGHHLYIQYGDIFSLKIKSGRLNIVIPVNRCFDTIVDDDLISSNSLHGKAMKGLTSAGVTEKELNSRIQGILSEDKASFVELSRDDKRKGNLKRYEVGTVVEIPAANGADQYFFLGLTEIGEMLKASVTDEDYVLALIKLLKTCDARSQMYPIVMPIIGGGLSRTKKSERDILEYLVKLIKINKELFHCDIYIVVRESGKDGIAIADL